MGNIRFWSLTAVEKRPIPTIRVIGCGESEPPQLHRKQRTRKHKLGQSLQAFLYHLKTMWLFVSNDIKSFSAPCLLFGVASAFGAAAFSMEQPPLWHIFQRIPLALMWQLILLLTFNIQNQSSPQSVEEDSINKPHRPIPSKRITAQQAQDLQLILYPICLAISRFITGGFVPCVILLLSFYLYNSGGSERAIARNTCSAIGMSLFNFGSCEALFGQNLPWQSTMGRWIVITGAVMATTLQTSDMYDQEGDKARHRRTIPIVIGDGLARWSIALPLAGWCIVCPWFWHANFLGYLVTIAGALTLAVRTLSLRTVKADHKTYRLWHGWLAVLYFLPLFQ